MGSSPPASPAHAYAWVSTSTTAERLLVLMLDLKGEMPHPAEVWVGFCPVHTRPDAPLAVTTSFACPLHHNPSQKILPQGTGGPAALGWLHLAPSFLTAPSRGFWGGRQHGSPSQKHTLMSMAAPWKGRGSLPAGSQRVPKRLGTLGSIACPPLPRWDALGAALPAQPLGAGEWGTAGASLTSPRDPDREQ